ncbi:hypothetical protein B4U81_02030 [Vibrio campbellii]|nr:hypothetical protein B4U81_02030 [Vibrio campbellii]
MRELLGFPRRRKPLHRKINWRNHHGSECKHKSNFERTTWFSETSETATSENQLEKSPWQ